MLKYNTESETYAYPASTQKTNGQTDREVEIKADE
jgi:hypothetical protein